MADAGTAVLDQPETAASERPRIAPPGKLPGQRGKLLYAILEMIGLALLPLGFYFLLGPAFFLDHINGLDANIYAACSYNLPDMFDRFGPTYYCVRFGLIFPGLLFASIFEPATGFYLLRYALLLLAAVPAYCLVKKKSGSIAAWIVYTLLITSVYFIRTLGGGNPEAVAVPYTLCGFAIMLSSPEHRRLAYFSLGVLFCLAFNANFFLIASWGLMVLPYAYLEILGHQGKVRRLAQDLAFFVCGFVVMFAIGVAYYRLFIGYTRIWQPTFDTVLWLVKGGQENWREPGFGWLLHRYSVYIPLYLIATWGILRRSGPCSALLNASTLWLAAVYGFHVFYDMFMKGNVLRFFLYYYYVVPPIVMTGALLFREILERLRLSRSIAALALIPGIGLLHLAVKHSTFPPLNGWPGLLTVAAISLVATTILWLAPRRERLAWLCPVLFLVAFESFALDTVYHGVFWRDRVPSLQHSDDYYRTLAQFVEDIPKLRDDPRKIAFYYPTKSTDNVLDSLQSSYLWGYTRVLPSGTSTMTLDADRLKFLEGFQALALLAEREDDLSRMHQELERQGVSYSPEWSKEYRFGSYRILVERGGMSLKGRPR